MDSPRQRFQVSGHAKAFSALVASESFEPACDYALLELQSQLPSTCTPGLPTDPHLAIDANSQIHGAARVLEILKHLHEPSKSDVTPKRNSLHYV
jgi:hypothetical protein